jgi:hypothetical protein
VKHPNDFYFLEKKIWGASPGSAGCFKKPTQISNAGHPILIKLSNYHYTNKSKRGLLGQR